MNHEVTTIAGIDIVFAELPEANSTTLQILTKAGSIYETEQNNGISHFLEHMFFKGGKKYTTPQIVAEVVDEFGGEFNAFTSEEYAGYYIKCAPEFVIKGLDVLADMMVHPLFPEEEMEREKNVVIQEIMMYEDAPRRLVVNKWKHWYYGNNSYGRPILGTVERVQSFTQEDLITHKADLYTKDNLILVIAGNLSDKSAIEQKIADAFAGLPEKKRLEKPSFVAPSPGASEGVFKKDTQQNHLIVVADGFTMHDDERYAARILSTILGGTMSSRLFQQIREKEGLCYYIGASHYENDDDGIFFLRAGLEKGRRDHGRTRIYEEVGKVAAGEISNDELQKALGNTRGKTKMGIESSDELANFVGFQYLFKKKIRSLETVLEQYEKVTLDDIINVAKRLEQSNLYTYWME